MIIKNVGIIGAGTMGNGIAQVFANSGFRVILCDVNLSALEKAVTNIRTNLERLKKKELISVSELENVLQNIQTTTDLAMAVSNADLVVEAATENIELKLKIFSQIDKLAPIHAILATNTSSISITKIASATQRPERVIGMHFMNPVPIMQLVEIIYGYQTEQKVLSAITETTKKLHKTGVLVQDYPGFVANRILMPMINEAIYALYENVAGVEEIDTIMKLGMAHPMGPLQLADFIGLDVCLSILNILYDGFGNQKYAPCPLLINMVVAGKFGKKSGEGFYKYTEGSKEYVIADKFKNQL